MQTIYHTTTQYIRHTGNVIDLEQYRRKLSPKREPSAPEGAARDLPRRPVRPARRRRFLSRLTLDDCAALAVLVMTVTVAVRFFAVF